MNLPLSMKTQIFEEFALSPWFQNYSTYIIISKLEDNLKRMMNKNYSLKLCCIHEFFVLRKDREYLDGILQVLHANLGHNANALGKEHGDAIIQ